LRNGLVGGEAMSYNKFPWTNMHGFNLDWVIETVQDCLSKVTSFGTEIENISYTYETKENITNSRKLSTSGDFTGTIHGQQASLILAEIDDNGDKIQYITDQFEDGAIGLVIDCGWFGDDTINNNYDGGVW
jgi:hypothetical protein